MPDLDYGYEVTIAQNATTDPAATTVINQWQRQVFGNTIWESITGSSGQTYTISTADRAAKIRLRQNLDGLELYSNELQVTSNQSAPAPIPGGSTCYPNYSNCMSGTATWIAYSPDLNTTVALGQPAGYVGPGYSGLYSSKWHVADSQNGKDWTYRSQAASMWQQALSITGGKKFTVTAYSTDTASGASKGFIYTSTNGQSFSTAAYDLCKGSSSSKVWMLWAVSFSNGRFMGCDAAGQKFYYIEQPNQSGNTFVLATTSTNNSARQTALKCKGIALGSSMIASNVSNAGVAKWTSASGKTDITPSTWRGEFAGAGWIDAETSGRGMYMVASNNGELWSAQRNSPTLVKAHSLSGFPPSKTIIEISFGKLSDDRWFALAKLSDSKLVYAYEGSTQWQEYSGYVGTKGFAVSSGNDKVPYASGSNLHFIEIT